MNLSKKWANQLVMFFLCMGLSLILSACDRGKRPYEEAEAFFNKSDYVAAKSKAAEVVQNAPKSKYLAQAKALCEKVDNIEAFIKRANEAGQIGDYNAAIKSYEDILFLDGNNAQVKEELPKMRELYQRKTQLLEVGKTFIESGEYKKGIEAYKEILTFAIKDKDANNALEEYKSKLLKNGNALIESGEYEKGIVIYKEILTFLPKDKDASNALNFNENEYPSCCRDEINKYKARRKSLSEIREVFSKEPSSDNEFERKREAEEIRGQKNAISRDRFFFDYVYSHDISISKYNFSKHEYKISFGVQKGSFGGETLGIPNSPDVLQIANDQGQRLIFTLKVNEKEAETFDKEQKEHADLFVIYKFVKGERFTYFNPLTAVAMQQIGFRGANGYEKDTRIYIKPVYVALLSGNSKITIYKEQQGKN